MLGQQQSYSYSLRSLLGASVGGDHDVVVSVDFHCRPPEQLILKKRSHWRPMGIQRMMGIDNGKGRVKNGRQVQLHEKRFLVLGSLMRKIGLRKYDTEPC